MVSLFVYFLIVCILSFGLYGLLSASNMVKKLISLSIMQSAVIFFYLCIGYKGANAISPVYISDPVAIYTNPLPQVLMLTAIVVGLAVNAIGLAIILMVHKEFGSVDSHIVDCLCKDDIEGKPFVKELFDS